MSHTRRIALVDAVITRLFLSAYSSRRTTRRKVRRALSRRTSCERCEIMHSLPPVVPNTALAQSSAFRLTRSHSRNESDSLAESGWLSLE